MVRPRTANYARKVRKLFSHMDDSGDGALSHDEHLGNELFTGIVAPSW